VELEKDKLELRAYFQTVEEKPMRTQGRQDARWRTYKHEMAAYLIDRQLNLSMIPVTVVRKIEGKYGSLQFVLELVKDWNWIKDHDQEKHIRKEYKEAVEKAYVFAALLDVEDRTSGAIMFLPLEKRIMLADNTKAFSLSPTVQERFRPDLRYPIDPELDLALRELEFKGLEKLVGKYLSKGQIQALLQRRDQILELCSKDNL
jgi:dTDP-D-glucose 4,6-dehydratase